MFVAAGGVSQLWTDQGWWHRAAGAMAAARELSQRETVSKFVRYSIAMLAVPLAVFAWMHMFGVSCACHPSRAPGGSTGSNGRRALRAMGSRRATCACEARELVRGWGLAISPWALTGQQCLPARRGDRNRQILGYVRCMARCRPCFPSSWYVP